MLKTLRTSTKWVMIIVAVCFVGMMVFAWGMDIAGDRGGRTGIVGIINGEKITYDAFNALLEERRSTMGANQPMTMDQERKLYDDVWDELVTKTLLNQEIKKRKIFYTDNELLGYMVNKPVEGVEQVSAFQNPDGTFSIDKYRSFLLDRNNLKNPQAAQFIAYIEEKAKSELPVLKLQRQIIGNIMVTDSQVRDRWLAQSEQRQIEYVFVPAGMMISATAPVDAKDVEAYYKAHKENFKSEEERSLELVSFPLAATPQDSANVLAQARLLTERAKKGEDFGELADGYSEDPGNTDAQGQARGGDLGFVRRGMTVPAFEAAIFSLKPGEVAGPIATQFGYHIVKVDSIRTVPAAAGAKDASPMTEVKVRHILLKVEPSAGTREAVENRVKQFEESAAKKGADFTAVAKAQGLDVLTTQPFKKDSGNIPFVGGNTTMLVHRVFDAKKDAVLPRYQTDGGFFVMKLSKIMPDGIRPLADVRTTVENKIRQEKAVKLAADFAGTILGRLQPGTTLAQVVQSDSVRTSGARSELVTRAGMVAGLGMRSSLVAKAFTLSNPGQNTGVVKTASGAGIAILQSKLPVDENRYQAEKAALRERMLNEIQNDVVSRYFENLRKNAKIIDNRSKVFSM